MGYSSQLSQGTPLGVRQKQRSPERERRTPPMVRLTTERVSTPQNHPLSTSGTSADSSAGGGAGWAEAHPAKAKPRDKYAAATEGRPAPALRWFHPFGTAPSLAGLRSLLHPKLRLTTRVRGRTSSDMERWIFPEHERAALRALLIEYDAFNRELFGNYLRGATLALMDSERVLGQWDPKSLTIRLQRAFVCTAPWLETLEVLKHEMAHQFVDEVYRRRDEPPHGPTFQRICWERGIDARASGEPTPTREASAATRRIEKLLALGESSEQHEAEAAMRKAQELLRSHNLSRLESKTPVNYTFRQLGQPAARTYAYESCVVGILCRHFFVDVIRVPAFIPGRAHEGWVYEMSGTEDNLDIAEYVHGFLLGTSERLWVSHRDRGTVPGRHRLRFLHGVMMGFRDKLDSTQQPENAEQRALVAAGDPELQAFVKRRYPRIVQSRGSRLYDDAATSAGRAAGQSIVLRKGVRESGPNDGRLLGPGNT